MQEEKDKQESAEEEAVRKIAESFGCDMETAAEIYNAADLIINID